MPPESARPQAAPGTRDMDWEAFYNNFRQADFVPGYEIQNRLGGGAFGDVYKARKLSIGKAYAIKFLKIEDEGQRMAVRRELDQVKHLASIDHPHLVSIEDMGEAMCVPYLIMGYAGEDTLARRMRSGGLEVDEALDIFYQACRGVVALHDRRLVHFDLKPSNIFLKGNVARIGDYGLSKLMVDGRTTLSFGRGTPQYMAPEMIRSRADHRADLYSLGVILYESLVGTLPYPPEEAGGLVLREEDQPPAFPAEFPARLKAQVTRALRLAPDERYATVAEFLTDLGQTPRPADFPEPAPGANSGAPAGVAGADPDSAGGGAGEARQAPATASVAREVARGTAGMVKGIMAGFSSDGAGADESAELEGEEASEAAAASQFQDGAEGSIGGSYPAASGASVTVATPVTPTVSSLSAAQTVPVPPPVDGGPLGTLLASLVLSLEVLVSLLGGAAAWVLRGFGMLTSKRGTLSPAGALAVPVDAASAPGRGAFSGLLKYLVALFVIGAVVMGLLLFLVIGAQEQ